MKKRVLVLVVIIISIILLFTNVYADTLDQQRKSVEKQIINAQKSLENISDEKNQIMEEVNNLNQSITENEAEISRLQTQIGELDKSIEHKQKDLDEKQKLLDERLSAVYMSSGNTYLEAFFNGGIINFVSNYDIIKQIAEYDNTLIDEVAKEQEELRISKISKENAKTTLEAKQTELNTQKTEREAKIATLTEEQQSMQAKIGSKLTELSRINEEVRNATEAADRSGGLVQGESASASAGGMTWPTRITHRVNSLYAPNGRSDTSGYVGTPHKGLDIYAPSGTPVYAAKAGTVVYVNYSGYGGGWGLYVVIYHGKDNNGNPIYTRYAHASSIASGISVGAQVTTSTVIMYAGNTGASEGAHLHFEVCVGGMYSQVNPCPYLGITNTKGDH